MKRLFFYSALAVALSLQSCALMFTGVKQKVNFQCPQGEAVVYLNLDSMGKTNTTIKIPRKDLAKLVTVKKEGYQDKQFEMVRKFNTVTLLDIPMALVPFVGWLWMVYDCAFDGDKRVDKEQIVDLKPMPTKTKK